MDSRILIVLVLCCAGPLVLAAGAGLMMRVLSLVYRLFAGI